MEKIDGLGQAIKFARNKMNYTRDDLSEKAGISSRYLLNIENKNQTPSLKVLIRIARALNTSLDDIVFPEKRNSPDRKDKIYEKLKLCNDSSLDILEATLNALLSAQNNDE